MPRSQSSKQNRIVPITSVVQKSQQSQPPQPPQQSQQLGSPSLSSLFQSIKQGFGFGLGNSIAHRLFSPNQVITVEPDVKASRSIGASSTQDMTGQIEYLQCMKEGGTEDSCKQYIL